MTTASNRMVKLIDDEYSDSDSKKGFRVDNLTTFEALMAGGDRRKEILLMRSNSNYNQILAKVLKEHLKQKLAFIYLDARSIGFLYVPTMAITLAVSGQTAQFRWTSRLP